MALLILMPLAIGTGFVAFALGTPELGAVVVVLHGAVGLAIALLAPWKSAVVRRGLQRPRPGRSASVTLAALVIVVVATGIAHSGGWRALGPAVTTMQVHVGAALATIPLLVWHATARPARPARADMSRRAVLRAGALTVGAAFTWTAGEGVWALAGTRGSRRRFTGSHETGSLRPHRMPVTQWLFDAVPDIDPDSWTLRVAATGATHELTLADLPARDTVRAVIDCTGGWWAMQDWGGVRLDRILGPVGDAVSVVVTSATGYQRRFDVADASSLWLATQYGGAALTPGHGAPARLVAPGRRGFWWVKWVVAVELDSRPPWQQPPFPLQ